MDDVVEGRSGFLVFAAFLANAFLTVYAIAALLAVFDDAVLLSPMDSALGLVRGLLGLLTLLLAFVALLAVIFVPHLPKLVFVPPIAVRLWQAVGAPPIAWSYEDRASWVPLDVIALLSVAGAFLIAKITTGHWFLAASRLPRKRHLALRTLIAIPVSMVVVSLLFGGMLVAGIVLYLEQETHGYLRFASSGVEVRETVMRRDDQVVHLAATVHFADARFYTELYRRIPNDALILAEGVSDREGRLKHGVPYGGAAQTLGLETQDVFELLIGPDTEEKPKADEKAQSPGKVPPRPDEKKTEAPRRPDVVHADLDVADFSPLTIRFIERIGEFYSSRTFGEVVQRLDAFGREFSDADIKAVMDDLIYKRNNHVLAELDKRLPNYTTVYIPWGAQHMHDMELALKERGFKIVSQRMIPLARYRTIFDAFMARARRAEGGVGSEQVVFSAMARPRGVEPLLQD